MGIPKSGAFLSIIFPPVYMGDANNPLLRREIHAVYPLLTDGRHTVPMSIQATAQAPGQTPVDDFNRRALENGWSVLCDPGCRFSASLLFDALELWRKAANGSIPYRRDMTARRLRPFIPVLSIYERVRHPGGGWRYRTRLMGTKLAFTTIEMSNRFVD
jgi:hypothetical protein